MPGALLRTGTLAEFRALGIDGQPVYSVAPQLREAIRLKMQREAADCLAIPQAHESGERIDWYAPFAGDVVPWSAATPEERQQALARLEQMQAGLRSTSQTMQADPGHRENLVFGRLLEKALLFPGPDHVYLVNGRPVVTFWGFCDSAHEHQDPLQWLRPATVPQVSSAPSPGPEAAPPPPPLQTAVPRSRWRWLWWLLLIPLFLLLLLFLLRACAPEIQLPLNLSRLDLPGLPPVTEEQHSYREVQSLYGQSVTGRAGGPLVGAATTADAVAGGEPAGPLDGIVADAAAGADSGQTPEPAPATPGNAGDPASPAAADASSGAGSDSGTPVHPELPAPGSDGKTTGQSPDAGAGDPAHQPLTLPAESLENGSTAFLGGNWKAGAGIQDARTGKPLQLDYAFDPSGQGKVAIHRGDGVQCSGAVNAAISQGRLNISNQGQASCSDGSSYRLPEVVCAPDAQSTADCTGRYGKQQFPMSMRHGGQ